MNENRPHVVKFSGGRSSGMMLIKLLEANELNAERGDVVVFNNTSAEHPATYAFTKRCKEYCESKFGIPFYWLEYMTVEDARNGEWTRVATYRLVNTHPLSDTNPDGYRWKGEVFEELLSHQGFLPGRQNRTCTSHLKLQSTSDFLKEWFAAKSETLHMGHYKDSSQITDESIIVKHRKARGKMEAEDLIRKKGFVRSRPIAREGQRYSDFSQIGSDHLKDSRLAELSLGDFAPMSGKDAITFVSLIGLRSDEPLRVKRVKSRNQLSPSSDERKKLDMFANEIVATPLAEDRVDREQVLEFWRNHSWQLRLPEDGDLSNCVFCFMKGTRAIPRIQEKLKWVDKRLPEALQSVSGTPTDINWWDKMERRYQRTADKRDSKSNEKVTIGFWGADAKESYASLKDAEPENILALSGINAKPCDCTD